MKRFFQCVHHFIGCHFDTLRESCNKVSSSAFLGYDFVSRECRSDGKLKFFCRSLADVELVLFSHIFDDCFIEFIACNLNGCAGYDSAEGNNRNIRGSATDIDYHNPIRLGNINSRTDCSGNRFFHQIYILAACLRGCFSYRSFLNFGNAARNAYHNFRLKNPAASACLPDEMLQHSLGYVIIRNNAVTQRSYCYNVCRRSSEHLSRFFADCKNFVGVLVDGNNRRFIQNDAFAFYIYKYIGCT